jgi:hypothetical protein
MQVIKEWLGRSGTTCLLDISIQAPPDFPNLNLLAVILAGFMPTCCRWKNLALWLPAELLPMLLSNPDAHLHALESLKLAMDHQPQFAINSSATRLRSISLLALQSPQVMPNGRHLDLAWGQIAHSNIQTATGTIDEIWDIFFQCRQLLSLIIVAPNNLTIPKITFHSRQLFHSNIHQLSMFVNTRSTVIGYFLMVCIFVICRSFGSTLQTTSLMRCTHGRRLPFRICANGACLLWSKLLLEAN